MKLKDFKYLHGRRVISLVLVLTLSSTLFSVTAFTLQGFYNSFNGYLGVGEDIVAIYDRGSNTPFTGLVPKYLAEQISSIDGVYVSSPEILVPCIVEDASIFLRGIIPEVFFELNRLTLVEGEMLEQSDVNSVMLGIKLAERLGLNLGDEILLHGVLKSKYVELKIKGIYVTESGLDDEALTLLHLGQWLSRANDYNYVTLIRVKTDGSSETRTKIFEKIAEEAQAPTSNDSGSEGIEEQLSWIIPVLKIRFNIEKIGVEKAQSFMKSYLDKFGVTRENLIILSIMVFIFGSISISIANKNLLNQHGKEIEILRSLGASNSIIKKDLLLKVLVYSFIASTLGIILVGTVLVFMDENSYLQILSHGIMFQLDPVIVLLNFFLPALILTLTILRLNFK